MGKESPLREDVKPVDLKHALEERYLAYALSTIMGRALPDARDGLKPVQRRILNAMRIMRLDPERGFKKCARIVGDVIGKYHPHGDQAVYDALVRLAQNFALRYPLVDGQGNFGNVDGDNAAAMRYTEAKMTKVASLLMEGITEDAVDFRDTYDGEDSEPEVLPSAFPNLLANGATGIAVGMAVSIPPHNAAELCEAALHLIENPDADVEALMEFVPGPDFPTGGDVMEDKLSIREAYVSGKGGFRVRAHWIREKTERGTWRIVVTEIPWQVQKSRLIEKTAELLTARKLPLIDDVRDESAEDVRIVIEPKSRAVDPELLMESLFRLTEFENRISLNMNVLVEGKTPKVLSLREALKAWLDHRRESLLRVSRFRLEKIGKRLEVLSGFLIAYLNLDEVIRIVRFEDEPQRILESRFSLSEVQSEAILNMRLRALAKLQEIEIRKEHESLSGEKSGIESLLSGEAKQWRKIASEIREVRDSFPSDSEEGKRRSRFVEAPVRGDFEIKEAMIEREPVTIILSRRGWIRAARGKLTDFSALSFKEGDRLLRAFHAHTTDRILLLSTSGKFHTLDASRLPGGRGHGEPVKVMAEMESDSEIIEAFALGEGGKRLLVSSSGNGFIVSESDLVANTRKGRQVMNVSSPDEAFLCVPVLGDHDHVAALSRNRKLLIFPLEGIPEMSRGKGVRLQKYGKGDEVAEVVAFSLSEGLKREDSSGRVHVRSADELADWIGSRALVGRLTPKGFPRGRFLSS